ncbi:MAG TPA: dihydrofolate reductase family protein, partial [Anaerolineae bacterium]
VLNNTQKYVASRTLQEPLVWMNSTLLKGDIARAVAALKASPGKDILILGSGNLLQTLIPHNLVDEYTLLIHPLVLGSGRRLFPDRVVPFNFKLVQAKPTTTGVIIAVYAPA